MRKIRSDYKENRSIKMWKAHQPAPEGDGLSYNDITNNPLLNPTRVSLQRVQKIIKDYDKTYKPRQF